MASTLDRKGRKLSGPGWFVWPSSVHASSPKIGTSERTEFVNDCRQALRAHDPGQTEWRKSESPARNCYGSRRTFRTLLSITPPVLLQLRTEFTLELLPVRFPPPALVLCQDARIAGQKFRAPNETLVFKVG